jgi:hypothetical protein
MALAGLALIGCTPPPAADTPEAVIQQVYAHSSAAMARGEVPYDYVPLSESLAAAITNGNQLAEERNEPFIEGDIATGCQDCTSLTDLVITTTAAPADGHATVLAAFKVDQQPREMTYAMVQTPEGWRVDNITSADGYDLRASVTSYLTEASQSCEQERGLQEAQQLVDRCIAVSPATHPPCNVQNHCGLIEGEIRRNCPAGDPNPSAACLPAL